MAKRPPKPDDQKAAPRFKADKGRSFASAVEAARKLSELRTNSSDPKDRNYYDLDDRSFAIVRSANVENALESALVEVLTIHEGERRALFRSEGPLGSFANKISMAYALNIIGPVTKKNLDIMRHIRNLFAHTKKYTDFDTKEVKDLCYFLSFPPKVKIPENDTRTFGTEDEKAKIDKYPEARILFLMSVVVTQVSLLEFCNKKMDEKIKKLKPNFKKEKSMPILIFDQSLP